MKEQDEKAQERIRDNPNFAEMRRYLHLARILAPILRATNRAGFGGDRILKALDTFIAQGKAFNETVQTVEKFNAHFAVRGWIAYESMNMSVMKKAVELAENNQFTQADEILSGYYNDELIKTRLTMMRFINEVKIRERLLQLALEDYAAERYHACVPVVLAQIDGIVSDVQGTGFFAMNTDLVLPDSIAAHSTGLAALAKAMSALRTVTTSENIDVPYRNGILHGRDLAYDNRIVAAKTWAILIALRDWVIALRKPPEPMPESAPNLRELMKSMQEHKEEIERLKRWKPRNVSVGTDFPSSGAIDEYREATPERALAEFIEYWQRKNYGKMAQLLSWPFQRETHKKTAGWLRRCLHEIDVHSFSIAAVKDVNVFATEIDAKLQVYRSEEELAVSCQIRLMHQDEEQRWVAPGNPHGAWRLYPTDLFIELRRLNLLQDE